MTELKKITGFTAAARLIFWLLVLLSLPMTMRAQTGASINGQALLATGKPAAFAQVRVCAYTGGGIPCSPLSSIFSDAALTQPVANPYTADQSGNFSVFAAPGYYILQLTIAGSGVYSYLISPSAPGGGSGGGVLSINGTPGAFTFTGPGVSCVSTTCTFSGGGSGQTVVVQLPLASSVSGSINTLTLTGCSTTVTFSSTPVFNLAQPCASRTITLTGAVSSSTATNVIAGLVYEVILIQDATGGRTFVWPTNFRTTSTINLAANGRTRCFFTADADLNLYPNGACTWN